MWWLRARVPQGRPESRLIRVRLLEFRCLRRRGDDAKMRFPSGTDSLVFILLPDLHSCVCGFASGQRRPPGGACLFAPKIRRAFFKRRCAVLIRKLQRARQQEIHFDVEGAPERATRAESVHMQPARRLWRNGCVLLADFWLCCARAAN